MINTEHLPKKLAALMATIKLDYAKINKAAQEAFKETCFLMGTKFTEVISEPGAFDGFPGQDIVDTGRLRASQQLEFVSPTEARFSWNTEYALYVLLGYALRNGEQQPGRDWTKEGLRRLDAQKTFALLLKAKLR